MALGSFFHALHLPLQFALSVGSLSSSLPQCLFLVLFVFAYSTIFYHTKIVAPFVWPSYLSILFLSDVFVSCTSLWSLVHCLRLGIVACHFALWYRTRLHCKRIFNLLFNVYRPRPLFSLLTALQDDDDVMHMIYMKRFSPHVHTSTPFTVTTMDKYVKVDVRQVCTCWNSVGSRICDATLSLAVRRPERDPRDVSLAQRGTPSLHNDNIEYGLDLPAS